MFKVKLYGFGWAVFFRPTDERVSIVFKNKAQAENFKNTLEG